MRAYVRLRLPGGDCVELGDGDIIGRMRSATLFLPDPRISEAHAMISLRGSELVLLPLRGRFLESGQRRISMVLEAGQRITLADGLDLQVEEVSLPAAVFAVEGDGLPRVVVSGVSSLLTRPRPELVPKLIPDAPAHIWSDGEGWSLTMGGSTRRLAVGDSWELDGRTFRAVSLALTTVGGTETRQEGGVARSLRIVAQFDSVHLHNEGGASIALGGMGARLLSELVAFNGPVSWDLLARELWPDEEDINLLRHKLDVTLSRLRSRLRAVQIRPDIVRSDGLGNVELFLHEGDRVQDRV